MSEAERDALGKAMSRQVIDRQAASIAALEREVAVLEELVADLGESAYYWADVAADMTRDEFIAERRAAAEAAVAATEQPGPARDFADCQACDHSELIDEGAGEPSLICRLFKCYACEAKFPCNSYKQQKGCRL